MKKLSFYIFAAFIVIFTFVNVVPGVFNTPVQSYYDGSDPYEENPPPSDPPPSDPTPPPPPPPVVPGTSSAPTIHIQFGDGGEVSPNHPGDCGTQLGTIGTSTRDYIGGNGDADCIRIKIVDSSSTTFSSDFRFCLSIFGRYSCTGWASDIGLTQSNGPMTAGQTGNLDSTMYAIVETRALPSSWPAGTTFGNIQAGAALAYERGDGPCRDTSGLSFAGQGDTWSSWAYGARDDDDPGCWQAGLRVGTVNTPPDAEYVSTTIPSTASQGSTHTNKNIVMKNTGTPWPIVNQSGSVVRDTDGHCDEGTFNYDSGGSDTCTDYKIYASPRFRLERLDSTAVVVKSKELGSNSNSISYSNGQYSYSGSDTTITAQSSRSSVSTSNTIPFYIKQQITYRRVTGSYDYCTPADPTNPNPGDPTLPQMEQQPVSYDFLKDVEKILSIKTANAYYDSGTGENCETIYYDYIAGTPDVWALDVNAGDNATFAPVSVTLPAGNGSYTLRFRMVDLQNLNTNSNGYEYGQFGDEAIITMQVGTPWSLSCTIGHSAVAGETKTYTLSATGTVPSQISVALTSVPTGPVATPATVVLNSANSYSANTDINTTGLAAGTYALSFVGTDDTNRTDTCNSSLTVTNAGPTAELTFNGSAGPVVLTGNVTSGTLAWTSANATSCTASTTPSAVTPPWDGVVALNDSQGVSGLAYGTTYTFNLTCTGPGGSYTDSVQVSSNSSNPTSDLFCVSGGQADQQNCTAPYGGSVGLHWNSNLATGCSISDDNSSLADIGSVPTNVSSSSPYNTGNLYTTTTFTLTCTGTIGTTPSVDSLTVVVNANPNYTFWISSFSGSVVQGTQTSVYLMTLNPVQGFNSPVTMSTKSITDSAVKPTVQSISNNPHTPPGSSLVTIDTANATPGDYTFEFAANGGGIAEKTQQFILTIQPGTPPGQPRTPWAVNTGACGTVGVGWLPDGSHNSGTNFHIYKSAAANGPWTLLNTVPYSGANFYNFTDGSPYSGSNYYYIVAEKNGLYSERSYTTPVSPLICAANADFSNKDLIRVNSNTASAGSDVENRCNGQSDLFNLPNQAVFKDGDKVYFRINVCNTGTIAMTGVTVTEPASVSGLTNIAYESSFTSPAGCVTNANDTTKVYTLGDIAPAVNGSASICSFVLSATVNSGGGPAGELFRFQNIANISSAQTSKTVSTPKYLFSVGSGVPIRNETAP